MTNGRSITGFGVEFEHRVTRNRARTLCGIRPLPRMGYETCVAVKRDHLGLTLRLWVQNISGVYVLASADTSKDRWEEVFNVRP